MKIVKLYTTMNPNTTKKQHRLLDVTEIKQLRTILPYYKPHLTAGQYKQSEKEML